MRPSNAYDDAEPPIVTLADAPFPFRRGWAWLITPDGARRILDALAQREEA